MDGAADSFASAMKDMQARSPKPDPGKEATAAARSILAASDVAKPAHPPEKERSEAI